MTGWEQLPADLRAAVEQRTGPVLTAELVAGGRNHHLAALLHTATGSVFLKGIVTTDRRAARQRYEADIAPTVAGIAPRLLWHEPDAAGWDLLAFDAVASARHADLTPGSSDQPLVTSAVNLLARLRRHPAPADPIGKRWAEHGTAHELAQLAGDHLLHTDLRPDNVLVDGRRAWIVDWAWPAHGPAWIDPACLALWLIASGHQPHQAETWLRTTTAGRPASLAGLDSFTAITARLWSTIAGQDPQPWKKQLAEAASAWADVRGVG